MKAFRQGELDSLCGLYSVINVCKLLFKIDLAQSERFLSKGLSVLEKHGKKPHQVIKNGMTMRDIERVMDSIKNKCPINYHKPFYRKPRIKLGVWWESVTDFLNESDSRAAIIGIYGQNWSHWTVVVKVRPKVLYTLDSEGRKTIKRLHLTTGKNNNNRPIFIDASSTVFCGRDQF